MNMKTLNRFSMPKNFAALLSVSFALSIPLAVVACDGDDTSTKGTTPAVDSGTPVVDGTAPKPDSGGGSTDSGVKTDSGGGTDGGSTPAPPALGAQIDRFGRPAVNTALNKTFEADTAKAVAGKNAYNADGNSAGWAAAYAAEVAGNLAILDALDSNCGNQLLAATGAPTADTYKALAGVLADDRQWVNTANMTCTQYLGVELGLATDCGGRKLGYDVIDTTYSALALGTPTGFGDTIPAVAAKTSGTTFPYLAPPL
jgi:hypothetical protein